MHLACIFLFILFLKYNLLLCYGIVIHKSLGDHDDGGWNIAKKIHRFCFNSTTSILIFRNDWYENQSKFLTSTFENSNPLLIFGKEANKTLQKHRRLRNFYKIESIHLSKKNYPATSVTIFIDEDIDFAALLEHLRSSIWWNSRAKFLLVGVGKTTCSLASELLRTIWDFSVLSAVYLCQIDGDKWAFYTFSPYGYQAPSFWTRGHEEWSLFQHVAEKIDDSLENTDLQLCKNLFFDKLQDLNSHTFRAVATDKPETMYDKKGVGYDRCVRNQILAYILKSMNVVYTVKFINLTGFIKNNGQPYDNINEVISGQVDFGLFDIFIRDYWWLQTYPYIHSQIHILTPIQSRYAMSFMRIFTPSSWILLSLLVVLTTVSLKYLLKDTLQSTFFEFVRMFVGQATLREPIRDFERVCFICPIYLWLILNIYIQSYFNADSIAVKQNTEIDSLEQLVSSDLSVHSSTSYKEMIGNEKIRQRFVSDSIDSCIKSLYRGESIACPIAATFMHIYLPKAAPIHVLKEPLTERGGSWLFADDSPLLAKVNSIMSRFNQAGLIGYHYPAHKIHSESDEQINFEFLIALRILIGGWLLALIVAVGEIVIGLMNHIYYV